MVSIALKSVPNYKTVAIPIGLWNEISHVVKASGMYSNEAEFVRDAVRSKLGKVSIVDARSVPEEEAEEEIVNYIRRSRRAYLFDITADLGIPYFTVLGIIDRLVEKGVIEPVEG